MRARVLYYMQIGYYALELKEPLEVRLDLVPEYLEGFTGRRARQEELEEFNDFARSQGEVRGRQRYMRLIGQPCEEVG